MTSTTSRPWWTWPAASPTPLPPFTWTVGPDTDGVTSILVAPDDEDQARAFFAERPLKVDGDRVLQVSTRPAAG